MSSLNLWRNRMNNIGWSFSTYKNGEVKGLQDPGQNYFSGSLIKSLAREITQNSLDAVEDGKQAIVEFSSFLISKDEVPNFEELIDAYHKVKRTWRNQRDPKTSKFVDRGIEVLSSREIQCLRISDFNTSGLTGVNNDWGGNWISLVKSSGASDKSSISGGSFGIGKYATFACSEINTVYYSTINVDGEKATQGVVRLPSFIVDENKPNEITSGSGYWGQKDENKPYMESLSLDSSYQRNESGTDIFILGFIDESTWDKSLIEEILDGFMYSLIQNQLEVRVNNQVINSQTLKQLVQLDYVNENIKDQYLLFTLNDIFRKRQNIMGYGEVELYLMLKERANRKVAMIRRPWMKIKDLGNISSIIQFTGAMIIEGEDLNSFLRKAENPKHINWEPERLIDDRMARDIVIRILKHLKQFIVLALNEYAGSNQNSAPDITGLSDILPLEHDEEKSDSDESQNQKIVDIKVKKTSKTETSKMDFELSDMSQITKMIEGGIVDEEDVVEHGDFGQRPGPVVNPNPDNEGGFSPVGDKRYNVPIQHGLGAMRVISINKSPSQYRLIFDTQKEFNDTKLTLYLLDDEGGKEKIVIENVMNTNLTHYEIANGSLVNVKLQKGTKNVIDLDLQLNQRASMEVRFYETE
jgi:hypothetical protein